MLCYVKQFFGNGIVTVLKFFQEIVKNIDDQKKTLSKIDIKSKCKFRGCPICKWCFPNNYSLILLCWWLTGMTGIELENLGYENYQQSQQFAEEFPDSH